MATFFTADPGEPHMEITATQIFINHSHDVRPPETVPGCVYVVPCLFQFFKMIFETLVICTCLRIAWLMNIKIICC